jgi:PAS domain S-box-containing protein
MEGIIGSWNAGAEKLYGYSPEEAIGKHISFISDPEYPDEIPVIMEKLKRGQRIEHYETVRIRKDGKRIDVTLTISPVQDSAGRLIGASAIARDITERKRLRMEAQFLSSIVESSEDAILTKDLNGIILSWNRGAEKIYGYTAEEMIGNRVSMLTPPGKEDEIPQVLERLRRGEKIEHYETLRMRKDKKVIDISLTVSPVKDHRGIVVAASAIARDITEKKQVENLIRSQLEEKNLLIQEVYHRVKNNLQLVCSLLELRLRTLDPEKTEAAFKDSIQRIRAMALLHENMYHSESLSRIDFKNYLMKLSEPLIQAYCFDHSKVDLKITGDATYMKLSAAVPLGLIFNEVLTNAFKYAFVENGNGTIHIDLREEDSFLHITISDDGVGLPENVNPLEARTFGFRIVGLLVTQLDGTLEIRRENGTVFKLTIPI